jgi:GntR family transcriptional regulator
VAAKFTRIPKVEQLIASGVPAEAIPTYCALADHSNNKSGLCWPKMETLATTLKRSVRTVQRHVHLLASRGWIELVERRRHKGRFSSYLYRVLHITKTTGHGQRVARSGLYKRRTKSPLELPNKALNSSIEFRDQGRREEVIRRRQGEKTRADYAWFFGE